MSDIPTWADIVAYGKAAAPTGLVTFILGALFSRAIYTKKERFDVNQVKYKNGTELAEAQNQAYQEFVAVMGAARNSQTITFDDFVAIASKGETYFYQLKTISDAILGNKIDPTMRDNTFVPIIREAVERLLPLYYQTLINTAMKNEYVYSGALRRENYLSLFGVAEKYKA
jgi:hypothetical protein